MSPSGNHILLCSSKAVVFNVSTWRPWRLSDVRVTEWRHKFHIKADHCMNCYICIIPFETSHVVEKAIWISSLWESNSHSCVDAIKTEMTYCDINADNTKYPAESKRPRLDINHQQSTAMQLTNVLRHGLDDCACFCTKGYRIPAGCVLVTKRRDKNVDVRSRYARMRLPFSTTRNLCPGTKQPGAQSSCYVTNVHNETYMFC